MLKHERQKICFFFRFITSSSFLIFKYILCSINVETYFVNADLSFPDNIPVAILHNIFIAGAQVSFELTDNDLEASELYPEHKYTSVDELLNRCLVDPPKPKMAAFA